MTTPSQINELAQQFWDELMAASPTWAHMLGDFRGAGHFEEASKESEDQQIAAFRKLHAEVAAVDPTDLSEDEQVTRDVLLMETVTRAAMLEAGFTDHAADSIFGLQSEAPLIASMLGVPTEEVASRMAGTLRGLGQFFRQLADRQRAGAAAGRVSPAFAVEGAIAQIDAWLDTPIEDDKLVAAIAVPEGADGAHWRRTWTEVVAADVRPGLAAYREALQEVLPQARPDDKVGLTYLPGGDVAYGAALRFFTTTDKSAQEIHDIGLAQIASLADEYRAMGKDALGTEDLDEIFTSMRTDPKLHFTEGQQLVEASEVAMARAWEAMPEWFSILPKAPCTVTGVQGGAKAFYFPPAADGSRGGSFFINISDPQSWGTFELEAMAFHEGIPGHHLQLAVAAELPDTVPAIRRFSENAAYAEGWGLYTERLADEMGLYSSQIDRLGMLAADSMRACRLVVDTGIHALGWSRQQAVDYMVANSPLTEAMCQPEIDRYIVTPGQACSYMIGRLEIQRIRAEAEALDNFDIKTFHSAVLDSGALPLAVLETVVKRRFAA